MATTSEYSSDIGDPYTLSSKLTPTGRALVIASRTMPRLVPRLGLASEDERLEAFVERAHEVLAYRSARSGRDMLPVNYGWLPLVRQVRDGPAHALEGAGVVIPSDAQRRLFGMLKRIDSRSPHRRDPQFYGPIVQADGKSQFQFFTGDTFIDRSREPARHALRLAYPDVARLLNAESTYVDLI